MRFNICPKPGRCEYDSFRRTGEHICGRVRCPYADAVRENIKKRIAALKRKDEMTLGEACEYATLRRQLAEME